MSIDDSEFDFNINLGHFLRFFKKNSVDMRFFEPKFVCQSWAKTSNFWAGRAKYAHQTPYF